MIPQTHFISRSGFKFSSILFIPEGKKKDQLRMLLYIQGVTGEQDTLNIQGVILY